LGSLDGLGGESRLRLVGGLICSTSLGILGSFGDICGFLSDSSRSTITDSVSTSVTVIAITGSPVSGSDSSLFLMYDHTFRYKQYLKEANASYSQQLGIRFSICLQQSRSSIKDT
jgi:hypothetical protein